MTILDLKHQFLSELRSFCPQNELHAQWRHCLDFIFEVDDRSLLLNPGLTAGAETEKIFANLLLRLKQYEPIQYISGYCWFGGNRFRVSPAVLIPRPETEELVELVSGYLKPSYRVLDIGTGSGCIAISLKKSMPDAEIVGMDISPNALEIAESNARQILGEEVITWKLADVLQDDFPEHFDRRFDTVVSNPPYIPENERTSLGDNVLLHEPALALFSGDDPLLFYRSIALHAKHLLKKEGLLFFELHEKHGEEVKDLLEKLQYREIELFRDMQGKNRMIKAKINHAE